MGARRSISRLPQLSSPHAFHWSTSLDRHRGIWSGDHLRLLLPWLSYRSDELRVIVVRPSTTTTASYSYDGDGLRQSKAVTMTQGTTATAETWDTAENLPHCSGTARRTTSPSPPASHSNRSWQLQKGSLRRTFHNLYATSSFRERDRGYQRVGDQPGRGVLSIQYRNVELQDCRGVLGDGTAPTRIKGAVSPRHRYQPL